MTSRQTDYVLHYGSLITNIQVHLSDGPRSKWYHQDRTDQDRGNSSCLVFDLIYELFIFSKFI
jgi:hypothetical protein